MRNSVRVDEWERSVLSLPFVYPSLWCFPSFPFPFLSLLSGVLLGTVLGFLSGVYLLTVPSAVEIVLVLASPS